MSLKITPLAKKFMEKKGIEDVTFKLLVYRPVGACVGIVKEIEAVHEAPAIAFKYRYSHVDGFHIYISREIKILGPLTVTLDGFWKMKRLGLNGATIPL